MRLFLSVAEIVPSLPSEDMVLCGPDEEESAKWAEFMKQKSNEFMNALKLAEASG